MTDATTRAPERQAVQVVVITTAWTVLFAGLALLLPFDIAARPLLMDSAFLPAHALAAWALWLVRRSIPRGTDRWWGFHALLLAQLIGILNSVVWVASSAGALPVNSFVYQAIGFITTALSVFGIARLVPLRRSGAAAVPWLDIALLLLAGASIGWYFVGWPILRSAAESTSAFSWFALITSADAFCALLSLAAWTYPTDRLGRAASACFAIAYGLSAWGDVVIETGTIDGTYVSGRPFDIIFALTALLMVVGAWRELARGTEGEASEMQVLTARALTPLLASAAVLLPVMLGIGTGQEPRALVVPVVITVLFVLTLQFRYLLLDREIERTLVQRLGLERDLALARQFESLGRFAGAIAHDFNNILAGLLGHVHLLRDDGTRGADAAASLDVMEESIARGTTLNRRLLGVMRGQSAPLEPMDFGAMVRSVTRALAPVTPPRVKLILDLPAEPVRVAMRPGDGDQLLLNLVLNSRDAMPEGGRLTVRLRPEGPSAILEIEDEGHGIPESIRERIFEPMFTTKAEQRGTGLGLATVRSVVAASGGTIALWSEEGRGTRITVSLPLAP